MRHLSKLWSVLFLVVIALFSCSKEQGSVGAPALIPLPQSVSWGSGGYYQLSGKSSLVLPEGLSPLLAEQINESLRSAGMKELEVKIGGDPNSRGVVLRLTEDDTLVDGAYRLVSHKGAGVEIVSSTQEGLSYGVQTLRQLITKAGIATAEISDSPRLSYRGVMLDVSRHYMSVDFIKRLLDELQYYKFNRFHWHLVDAGGWRLQLDAFPELTEKTAYRTESDWDKWWIGKDRSYVDEGQGGYGGYYTKAEVREIVAYAAERGITVIPEIEMPGHSEEVLYTYPALSCSGRAMPNESDFCIGNPETYTFLQRVMDEVMELFPSEYIHIGGDEAGKGAWKNCPKCQALMKREGMSHVDELQSHLIHEMELYLNDHGRQIIGWDEILEGGLAPNATVMSWRGEDGGIKAAQSQHNVVMTPNSHLYFDYYQEDPTMAERRAIGGYIPLERVYSYDPVPAALAPEERKYIYGVQANLWTEYVMNDAHAEYMLFPRLLALSEVAWTNPEFKSWEDFRVRVNSHIPELQSRGVNTFVSRQLVVDSEVDYDEGEIRLSMTAERYPHEIRYRLDGNTPTASDHLYHEGDHISVGDSAILAAAFFEDGKLSGSVTTFRVDYHKGVGKRVEWQTRIGGGYNAGGAETALLDGYRGSFTYMDGKWLGNAASRHTIGVIDMGEPTELSHVYTKCMHDPGAWVYMPEWVELSLSEDGEHYDLVDRVASTTDISEQRLRFETFHFYPKTTARYLKIDYYVPQEQQFLFTDEIVIW
ncbi:MAG: family 20 glycosylhydrolase [Porphyromonas sp.]|nr:family 20 glycosylhydrolase [Porphyromonas sp.]